jgi:hypothetical protein
VLIFNAAGTDGDCMYTLVAAPHALKNNTASPTEMSLGECQDSSRLDEELIRGKILVCSYSIRFVLGLSSVKQALDTAKNVSAAGVIFYLDPYVLGFQLNPTPMHMPGLIIPSSDDSKVRHLMNQCFSPFLIPLSIHFCQTSFSNQYHEA